MGPAGQVERRWITIQQCGGGPQGRRRAYGGSAPRQRDRPRQSVRHTSKYGPTKLAVRPEARVFMQAGWPALAGLDKRSAGTIGSRIRSAGGVWRAAPTCAAGAAPKQARQLLLLRQGAGMADVGCQGAPRPRQQLGAGSTRR